MAISSKNCQALQPEALIDTTDQPVSLETENRPFWQQITEIGSEIPNAEWMKIPTDGSINYKHYLYGAPKQN